MNIQTNVPLANYSTMQLGGRASHLVTVQSENDLLEALIYSKENNLDTHITGAGSNTIYSADGFNGLVIVNSIKGIEAEKTEDSLTITAGSGENWDDIVAISVNKGYFDIVCLSRIPGTTGAAPVQNIGAYGQQISDSLISVRAYDQETKQFVELLRSNCNFSYRHSRFNTTDKHRFIITSIKVRLHRKNFPLPLYTDISRYLKEHNITEDTATPQQLREAITAVRTIKLPDPSVVANCGSFFKNPVIAQHEFNRLKARFPELKSHRTDDGNLKLYGAQLIELAGLKDYHDNTTGMATWKHQALVLVNESAKTTNDLMAFKQRIIRAVENTFGITLQQEPELIK